MNGRPEMSGVRELLEYVDQLERDCMTLALRLYGESDSTFSPETVEVMSRMRPLCDELLSEGPT